MQVPKHPVDLTDELIAGLTIDETAIVARVAQELAVKPGQVAAVTALTRDGATVPFISRYRKEMTGSLDEVRVRESVERLVSYTSLETRRLEIIRHIHGQGKLDAELYAHLGRAATLAVLLRTADEATVQAAAPGFVRQDLEHPLGRYGPSRRAVHRFRPACAANSRRATARAMPTATPATNTLHPLMDQDLLAFEDLSEGMKVKGRVKNVVDFGAFVDLGIKETGLVHVSEMSDGFVKDPMAVLKVGDVKEFRILSLDPVRRRIGLSLKTPGASPRPVQASAAARPVGPSGSDTTYNPFEDLLRKKRY